MHLSRMSCVWPNSADTVHWQKGRSKWDNHKRAWLDSVAQSSALRQNMHRNQQAKTFQDCDRQEDAQALTTLSCKPQQAVMNTKLQLFWKQKAGPEMKLLLEQHTAGKAMKCCCRHLPENEILLIYMQCPNLTKTNLFTTFTIKMLQSGYQVNLIKTWPVCHCWQHRSQSRWHCWWQSEILHHNSS